MGLVDDKVVTVNSTQTDPSVECYVVLIRIHVTPPLRAQLRLFTSKFVIFRRVKLNKLVYTSKTNSTIVTPVFPLLTDTLPAATDVHLAATNAILPWYGLHAWCD